MTKHLPEAPMAVPARDGERRPRGRANGEGSIYPYRNIYAAYVWVTTPAGERKRKYVYGKTREIVHAKWIELQAKAVKAPVATVTPTLEEYLASWLAEVIKPNRELATYDQHETMTRLYIVPALGGKKVDRLRVRQVQTWLNSLPLICQCCAQGKDAKRPDGKRRCCAIGICCESYPGKRTVQAARNTLRAALSQAVIDELVPRKRRVPGAHPDPAQAAPQRIRLERRGSQPVPGIRTRRRRSALRRVRAHAGARAA
jgi:hypothetical protein